MSMIQISTIFFVPEVLHYGSKNIHKTETNDHILWEDEETSAPPEKENRKQ